MGLASVDFGVEIGLQQSLDLLVHDELLLCVRLHLVEVLSGIDDVLSEELLQFVIRMVSFLIQ